jgi:hypothetical protein
MRAEPGLRTAAVLGIFLGTSAVVISTLPSPWPQLLLVLVALPFLGLISGNLRKLLLGVALLDIPLQLDTHLGFRPDLADLGSLGGWSISATTFALCGLYGLWAIELLGRVGRRARPDWRASLPATVYLACVGLSLLIAEDVTAGTFQLVLLAQMLLLYVYIVSTIRTREDVVFVLTLLLGGLLAESALMIALHFIGQNVAIPGIAGRVSSTVTAQGQDLRIGGTIGSANSAAIYLSLLLAPALSVLLTPLGPWRKRLAFVALTAGAGALLVTLSRGGWVAFGVSAVIVCVLATRRRWLSPSAPAALAGLAVVAALMFQDTIADRLVGYDEGSAHSRVPLMQLAIRIIEDQPVLGVGANNYGLAMQRYVTPDFSDYGGEWLYLVHNNYLLVWAETGVPGLVAFLWFVLATVWMGWRAWRRNDRLLAPLALGLTAALIGHLIYMSVDLFNDRAHTQTLWVSAALLACISKIPVHGRALITAGRRQAG